MKHDLNFFRMLMFMQDFRLFYLCSCLCPAETVLANEQKEAETPQT